MTLVPFAPAEVVLSADDLLTGWRNLSVEVDEEGDVCLVRPDGTRMETWRENHPYNMRMSRTEYEREKRLLQIELLKLQSWIKDADQKVVLIFEGRDAAGKGGTIKRFIEHLNPRGARVVALTKPSPAEAGSWYFQRYVKQLPTGGEIVLFDRSWYSRAVVERVMGFCSDAEYMEFMRQAPDLEKMLSNSGLHIVKFWFAVSRGEQRTRFTIRRIDPVRRWKLSPIDLASLDRWDDYTHAKEAMFYYTDSAETPWTVVQGNDKRRARLEAMRHLLSLFDYPGKDHEAAGTPDPLIVGPPKPAERGRFPLL
ncbi:MAG: polyphosphate kinase 2 [Streptosporangiaceae bacterium]